MRYEYFVSYFYTDKAGGFGFGSTPVRIDRAMTAEAVKGMQDEIARLNPGKQIVIVSFQQLHTPTATV